MLDKEYQELRKADDVSEDDFDDLSVILENTLDEPSEIWHDGKIFEEFPIFIFIKEIPEKKIYHLAFAYVSSDDEPSFIFLHFLTKDLGLVEHYRRVDLVYDKSHDQVEFAVLEGDSLSEGDPLAMGLFLAMLNVRGEKDVPTLKYQEMGLRLREETIESADEIWRSTDSRGNILVSFIKEFPDEEINDLKYVAVTQEEPGSNVHVLLFSFPTTDDSLVDRYRHGENLQAEEVSQESSH